MQKFNKYSGRLIITTALYFLVQILYSWRMEPTGKAQLFSLVSAAIIGANIFFIIRLNNKFSDQLLKVFNSYLLISTFGFYLAYCLKASLITSDPDVLKTPLFLELLLLASLLFNAWQIFLYSREIKAWEKKNAKKKKSLFGEIFSWVDALLSAVIFVLLINIFLIQIYSIPSESMYPVFFVKDRPVVDKITRGPELPFTRFRIPPLQKIHRGDIVTFRNPKYKKTVESELKHLLSQFLYMITFTTVNIDRYDEAGNEKADPLVKRVVGLPGEQIQIINDVIYYRESLDEEFKILEKDIHSETDLYTLPQSSLNQLQYLPIDRAAREMLTEWDRAISGLDRTAVLNEIDNKKREAEGIRNRLIASHLAAVKNGLQNKYDRINKGYLSIDLSYQPFQKIENLRDDNVHFIYNLDDAELWSRGWEFLSHGARGGEGEFFDTASNTDLRYKQIVSSWILDNLRYMEGVFTGLPTDAAESGLEEDERLLGEFLGYILRYYDFRNLPPFPANGLIEDDNYFVMGDNRYNSLDLRHGLNKADRFFVGEDENSFVHKSYLHPVTIDERWIEGFVVFRLFPLGRIGIP
ncbi:signal peptidase I [Spirochaeta isovalerica]|uniref:Signal peptidase I n=1 Tax=Spirochaeta isovalerica TaxID=150 RepID=A0A841R6X7_9SPIO|nr:signal peptidase I [Spirochaeta isovalerica]MBB6480974.1 signal peptidase I [Spirochaeta isovalerica]